MPLISAGPAVELDRDAPVRAAISASSLRLRARADAVAARHAGRAIGSTRRIERCCEPQPIELPFAKLDEQAAGGGANGYAFTVPVGRRVAVNVASDELRAGELFVDLFRTSSGKRERVAGALPGGGSQPVVFDAVEGGDYVMRVQPPLGATAGYDVEIAASALLSFPVDGVDGSAIWSGFGAERDGGRRAHRGVDIFARAVRPCSPRPTAGSRASRRRASAATWSGCSRCSATCACTTPICNEQWVEPGDFVLAGEPVGAVGNTGNAITTPPHLHFGVYVRRPGVRGGAQDPAEFLR